MFSAIGRIFKGKLSYLVTSTNDFECAHQKKKTQIFISSESTLMDEFCRLKVYFQNYVAPDIYATKLLAFIEIKTNQFQG
jgi:hypothetical protein